jgi:hypothetical protein
MTRRPSWRSPGGSLDRERIRDGEPAFIQKPFTAPMLLEKVRSVLEARQGLGGSAAPG